MTRARGDMDGRMSVAAMLAGPRQPPRPPATVVVRTAEVSECERYRWTLTREMRDGCVAGNAVLPWIMLNPSTADALRDDPTICRIMGFTWRWGFDIALVLNLFPRRAADPTNLLHWLDHPGLEPALRENGNRVAEALSPFDAAMAAWGVAVQGLHCGSAYAIPRLLAAIDAERRTPLGLFALATTKYGHPTHPMARGRHRVGDDALPRPVSREALMRSLDS